VLVQTLNGAQSCTITIFLSRARRICICLKLSLRHVTQACFAGCRFLECPVGYNQFAGCRHEFKGLGALDEPDAARIPGASSSDRKCRPGFTRPLKRISRCVFFSLILHCVNFLSHAYSLERVHCVINKNKGLIAPPIFFIYLLVKKKKIDQTTCCLHRSHAIYFLKFA
jgi:hypothetical protein